MRFSVFSTTLVEVSSSEPIPCHLDLTLFYIRRKSTQFGVGFMYIRRRIELLSTKIKFAQHLLE
jgi:hypothetical protein